MKLAGLDIGTTGCKISIYTQSGELLSQVYQDYCVSRTNSAHEVDASAIWSAVKYVISKSAEKHSDISGIGVTSFGETFVMLDENDNPLYNAILYTDPRGNDECNELIEKLGRDNIARITGLSAHPMYSISKLMWIKSNLPDVFVRAKRILQMEDFIVYMLTGVAQIDYSLATRTMAFDIQRLKWSSEIFGVAGINKMLFSTPVPIGTSAGKIKADVADELGLTIDTIIVSCAQDQVSAAVGSGVFDETVAVDGSGTVECITPVFSEIPQTSGMTDGGYAIVPYTQKGKYVCYAFSYTGGALIKWFVDNLAGYAVNVADKNQTNVYAELEGMKPLEKPTGLLVLPHFAGAATPYMDSGSRGAIIGLTIANTQQDIFCALMEGVSFEMRLNMERLSECGIKINRLVATGGGAKSEVWTQMKADILNIPIVALATSEAGAAGSAMMVSVAKEIYPDLQSAAKSFVKSKKVYEPRVHQHEQYNKIYKRYKQVYNAIRPLVEENIC